MKIPVRYMDKKGHQLVAYRKKKSKQLRRHMYYKRADIKTGIKVKRDKNIYNPPKKD